MAKASGREDEIARLVELVVASYDEDSRINHLGLRPLPSRDKIIEVIDGLKEIVFPGYFGRQSITGDNIVAHIGDKMLGVFRTLTEQVYRIFLHECKYASPDCGHCTESAESVVLKLLGRIPDIRRMLAKDVQAAFDGDPAAKSLGEIIFSYPGLEAITVYRFAHELYLMKVPLLPRIMTEYAHSATGIDIHPGATIGASFFMDHGTGIVIGETTEIGNNVRIYQGVTLGAHRFPKDDKGQLIRGRKRHPTIEDNVTIYSGATILGADAVIGKGSVVGGNVWLTGAVPPGSVVTSESSELVYRDKKAGRDSKGASE